MTFTTAAIAKLAFDTVIQTSAGKLTKAAIKQGKQLWQKIRGTVKTEGVTETTLVEVENQKSLDLLEQQIVPFLQVVMLKNPQFVQEIQEGSRDNIQMNAYAYDQSTVKQVGKIEADHVEF